MGAFVPAHSGPTAPPVWVIGLGTHHGDDQVGWRVIDQLAATVPPGVGTRSTPDTMAVTSVSTECKLLIVVDACRGADTPGTVHRFVWPDTRLAATLGVSSHGVGLVHALRLAEALERLPPTVIVLAVESLAFEPGSRMSSRVQAAIPEVVRRVMDVIHSVAPRDA
jgi:hydrogenase maturation protease